MTNSLPSSPFFTGASIEFLPDKKTAVVHLKYASWPHSAWMVRLQILNADGKAMHQSKRTLENSGTIETVPFTEDSNLAFDLGQEIWPQGKRFRLSIETLWAEQGNAYLFGEEAPLTFSLSTVEYSEVFRALWLKVDPTNGQAIVRADVWSWPKCRWRMRLELFDGGGHPAGKGEKDFENSGLIAGRPMRSDTNIEVTLKDFDASPRPLRRYLLRVERVTEAN